MLTSAPFDNWWHNAYGLDVKIVSLPHSILALGEGDDRARRDPARVCAGQSRVGRVINRSWIASSSI